MEASSQNILYLGGRVKCAPVFSHESHGTRFFSFPIMTRRLSGTFDVINVIARESIISPVFEGGYISINAELRSFNKRTDSGNRLIISAFAKEIEPCEDGVFENTLHLTGTVCKPPVYRKTPLGREICDIMLAINRKFGRSDYLPLIVWGRNAQYAEAYCVGDVISVFGRVQSREYTKLINGVETARVAYEVSVSSIESGELCGV